MSEKDKKRKVDSKVQETLGNRHSASALYSHRFQRPQIVVRTGSVHFQQYGFKLKSNGGGKGNNLTCGKRPSSNEDYFFFHCQNTKLLLVYIAYHCSGLNKPICRTVIPLWANCGQDTASLLSLLRPIVKFYFKYSQMLNNSS